MCGIFGFITDKPGNDKYKLVKKLMLESEVRGDDATGVAFVTKDNRVHVIKSAIPAPEFVEKVLPKLEEEISQTKLVIGHTRSWTVGPPSDNNNNHPVYSTHWVMVHNGMCSNINKIKDFPYLGTVDSELYLAQIETKGLEEGLATIGYHTAAVALINRLDTQKLHLFYHKQEFYMGLDDNDQTLIFASTSRIITRSANRRLLVFSTCRVGEPEEDVLYTVSHSPLTIVEGNKITIHYKDIGFSTERRTIGAYTNLMFRHDIDEYENFPEWGLGSMRNSPPTPFSKLKKEWDKEEGMRQTTTCSPQFTNATGVGERGTGQTDKVPTQTQRLQWNYNRKQWVMATNKNPKEVLGKIKHVISKVTTQADIVVMIDPKDNIIGYTLPAFASQSSIPDKARVMVLENIPVEMLLVTHNGKEEVGYYRCMIKDLEDYVSSRSTRKEQHESQPSTKSKVSETNSRAN